VRAFPLVGAKANVVEPIQLSARKKHGMAHPLTVSALDLVFADG
jgi:hypothetical protein